MTSWKIKDLMTLLEKWLKTKLELSEAERKEKEMRMSICKSLGRDALREHYLVRTINPLSCAFDNFAVLVEKSPGLDSSGLVLTPTLLVEEPSSPPPSPPPSEEGGGPTPNDTAF